MTLNELRYVVAVARERHFGRAADACFVSQPTLSVAVKKLEEELGVMLFERGTGEVSITEVGAAVVARAQRVLEEAEGVLAVARSGRDPLVGPLRVGAIYTVGPYLLPRLVPALRESAPRMPLLIEENFTAALADRLKQAQLDVIVISLPFDEPGIRTLALYDEAFVVLLPGDHPWVERGAIEPAALAGERVLLLGPGHCFRDQVLELCPECGNGGMQGPDGFGRGLEGGSLETIRCMVASNVGITVLPMSAAREDRLGGRIVCARPFAGVTPSRRVALAWRKSFPRLGAIEAVAAAVRAANLGDGIAMEPTEGQSNQTP